MAELVKECMDVLASVYKGIITKLDSLDGERSTLASVEAQLSLLEQDAHNTPERETTIGNLEAHKRRSMLMIETLIDRINSRIRYFDDIKKDVASGMIRLSEYLINTMEEQSLLMFDRPSTTIKKPGRKKHSNSDSSLARGSLENNVDSIVASYNKIDGMLTSIAKTRRKKEVARKLLNAIDVDSIDGSDFMSRSTRLTADMQTCESEINDLITEINKEVKKFEEMKHKVYTGLREMNSVLMGKISNELGIRK